MRYQLFNKIRDTATGSLPGVLSAAADERAYPGYRTQGRTPYQAFWEGVKQMSQEVEA